MPRRAATFTGLRAWYR